MLLCYTVFSNQKLHKEGKEAIRLIKELNELCELVDSGDFVASMKLLLGGCGLVLIAFLIAWWVLSRLDENQERRDRKVSA